MRAMAKRFILAPVGAAAALAGCHLDMHDQPHYEPMSPSARFRGGSSALPLPPGTVPRDADEAFEPPAEIALQNSPPYPPTAEGLARGRERYGIYCVPCHGALGDGRGMIVQRGFQQPPSFHEPRLRAAPLGHFYQVITNGFGAMAEYASDVPPADRWLIAMYVRALQRTQSAAPVDQQPARRAPTPGAAP